MGNARLLLLAVMLLPAGTRAQAPSKGAEIAAEPFHKLVLQNEYTRVFRVELPPGQSTQLHRHEHDYVAVHLSAAQVENAREGSPAVMQSVQFGQVGFTRGGFSHRVTNKGNTAFRVLAIEVLKSQRGRGTATRKQERGMEIGSGSTVDTIVDNEEVRVTETLLAPGATLEKRQYARPHLVIALSDLELHNLAKDRRESMMRARTGEVLWAPAGGTQPLMNMGKQQARFMEVEFK